MVQIPVGASDSVRQRIEAFNARRALEADNARLAKLVKEKKEGWPEWLATLVADLKAGEMREAANMILCSTRISTFSSPWTAVDEAGHTLMFTHADVLLHAPALWAAMQDGMIAEGHESKVRAELIEAGWKI